MKPTKSQVNRIKMRFFKLGPGSKHKAAIATGLKHSQITRLIKGGTIKEDKYDALLSHLDL